MPDPVRRNGTAPAAGLTTTSPSDTAVGDLVIVYTFERLGAGSASTLTLGGSMTRQLCNHFHNDGSTDGALGVAAVVATNAGAQSYQGFTSSTGSPAAWTGCEIVEAGTFNSDLDAISIGTPATQTGTGLPNPPSVTLDTGQTHLVIAISAWHLGSSLTLTPTAPTGYGNLQHVAGAANADIACASLIVSAGPASEDPGTFGDNQTPNGTCSFTLAVPGFTPPAPPPWMLTTVGHYVYVKVGDGMSTTERFK